MELEENKIYSLQEMKDFFGVTNDKWKKDKDKLLKHLSNFYDYEVKYNETDRRKKEYLIIKKIKEYQKYDKPKNEKTILRDKIFEQNIVKIVEEDNIQTSSNVNRIMRKKVQFISDNYTEGTSYEYTRIRMIEFFGKNKGQAGTKGIISEKIWCKLDKENNKYIPLDEDIISDFFGILKDRNKDNEKEIAEKCCDYENGLITKGERDKYIGEKNFSAFILSKQEFFEKYGYNPIYVPKYEFSAFINEEKENDYGK